MTIEAPRDHGTMDVEALSRTLNLGCGEDYRPAAHNVDITSDVNPDAVFDISNPMWPLPSNHFFRVIASHVFEHVDDIPYRELERVCHDGAVLELTYPIGHTRFEDPTHRQYWGWHTAEALAGDRDHVHEVSTKWTLFDRAVDWELTGSAPLERLYIAYRRRVDGLGPWLEQVPGVYGEITATYKYTTSR
jgi:hypothetical protein